MKDLVHHSKLISQTKLDFVVVGSLALYLQNSIGREPFDIDCVVLNLDGLPKETISYSTDSKFSTTGKRAFYVDSNLKIDIFVEDKLPEYIIVDGIKVQTVDDMKAYYARIYHQVDDHWKKVITNKLKEIQSWMAQKI